MDDHLVPDEVQIEEDFKVLSATELEELIDEDPQEALRYQFQLKEYEEAQGEHEQARGVAGRTIQDSYDRINEAVPGLYDKDATVMEDMVSFAVDEMGFNEAFLEVMTDPETTIIRKNTDGKEERYTLGQGAASLVELLHKFQHLSKGKTPSASTRSSEDVSDVQDYSEAELRKMSKEEREKILGG